jgi:ubiquinone/menaquinone biosynthesis C-methylase UbiE
MDVRTAYNSWSEVYDSNENKTRDLEAFALKIMLRNISCRNCLEIGCGTGKNTVWLLEKSDAILAVDISDGMLEKAKSKISSSKVEFKKADITRSWDFTNRLFDLVTFSLVLEHVADLDFTFQETHKVTEHGGFVYLGELHPYKQYLGTKARFETEEGKQVVECYNHHISEFISTAEANGFKFFRLQEFFDSDNTVIPRILSLVFQKA